MRVFAIADPHLSRAQPKPMSIFGGNWEGHPDIFFTRWQETVQEDDLVLIPGDISWAMSLEDALFDLQDIAALPGQKVLIKGNHDYWWGSVSKVRKALPESMYVLQNDALTFGDIAIAGTRGWVCPSSHEFSDQDKKIYERELGRLRLSLKAAAAFGKDKLIVMLHYPPTNAALEPSGFTELLAEFKADVLVYGHLHGEHVDLPKPDLGDTSVHFVAADALAFYPKQIL